MPCRMGCPSSVFGSCFSSVFGSCFSSPAPGPPRAFLQLLPVVNEKSTQLLMHPIFPHLCGRPTSRTRTHLHCCFRPLCLLTSLLFAPSLLAHHPATCTPPCSTNLFSLPHSLLTVAAPAGGTAGLIEALEAEAEARRAGGEGAGGSELGSRAAREEATRRAERAAVVRAVKNRAGPDRGGGSCAHKRDRARACV